MFDHVVVGGAADLLIGGRVAEASGYFFTSISESTQQGCNCGTLARASSGTAASASPELSGPHMTLTLWPRVSSAAAFTALVGSLCVSRTISSICRPSMPPAALISSHGQLDAAVDADAGGRRGAGERRQVSDPDRIFLGDGGLGDRRGGTAALADSSN